MTQIDQQRLRDDIRDRTSIVELVQQDVPLKRRGQEHWGCCPFHSERTPSFKCDDGRGRYHCFGCGASGDVFKWVMERTGCTFPEAVQELGARAGLITSPDGRKRPVAKPVAARKTKAEQDQDAQIAIDGARALWDRGLPIGDTPAERYLAGRGITVAPLPPTLRFIPHLSYVTSDGDYLGSWPAMLGGIQNAAGRVVAVHQTWLQVSGLNDVTKAPVPVAKRIRGRFRCAALRLTPVARRLYIAEGIETALSIRQAVPDAAVWCAASRANFTTITLPPDVRELVICADNDDKDPADGQKMLDKAVNAHRQKGLHVGVAWPDPGTDFNDMLQGVRSK